MKKKNKKKIKVTKTSWFWLYYVTGILCILLSIIFVPLWEEVKIEVFWSKWSRYALGIMMATAILVYVFSVLIKRLKAVGQHKVVRIIMGIEFSFMILLSAFCIIKSILLDNQKFQFFNTLEIVAIIMWLRGFVEIINAYYFDKKSEQKYPIWFLLINVFLLSGSPLLLVLGIKYNQNVDLFVSYGFCFLLLFFGAFLCIMGVLTKPIKVLEEPADDDSVALNEDKTSQNKNETLDESTIFEEKKDDLDSKEKNLPVQVEAEEKN